MYTKLTYMYLYLLIFVLSRCSFKFAVKGKRECFLMFRIKFQLSFSIFKLSQTIEFHKRSLHLIYLGKV